MRPFCSCLVISFSEFFHKLDMKEAQSPCCSILNLKQFMSSSRFLDDFHDVIVRRDFVSKKRGYLVLVVLKKSWMAWLTFFYCRRFFLSAGYKEEYMCIQGTGASMHACLSLYVVHGKSKRSACVRQACIEDQV